MGGFAEEDVAGFADAVDERVEVGFALEWPGLLLQAFSEYLSVGWVCALLQSHGYSSTRCPASVQVRGEECPDQPGAGPVKISVAEARALDGTRFDRDSARWSTRISTRPARRDRAAPSEQPVRA